MSRRDATPITDRRIGSVRNDTIGQFHFVGSKLSRAVFLAPALGGRVPARSRSTVQVHFSFLSILRYSGMRSAARNKPSITSWRAANASYTCNSIPIGRLGQIRKGARRGNENRRQPMEVLPKLRRSLCPSPSDPVEPSSFPPRVPAADVSSRLASIHYKNEVN